MKPPGSLRKLILFSGNDYLGLSSHPTVCRAVAEHYNMGWVQRGSASDIHGAFTPFFQWSSNYT
ncbi:hypothetical protein IFM89_027803 [Coptis chinensis]|uniref:8-amino-7-oxononanoate synthase n=1 Tax=Coptis chinensis TaxID=261450 RepID=A0A835IY48_9MAGN|nr:hypothetical protein IFM89_027803 [Coptis chinensis]